jgi:NAD(P)H-binding
MRRACGNWLTILGAGGVIANEVVKLLSAREHPFRLVARNARPVPGAAEMISADLSDKDQTVHPVAGSSIVYLLVGLKYNHKFWAEMWPPQRSSAPLRDIASWAGRLIEWFNPIVGEVYEMLYQNDSPYLFDSSKFARAFSFAGTPYTERIRATAASFQKAAPSTK